MKRRLVKIFIAFAVLGLVLFAAHGFNFLGLMRSIHGG